LAPDDLAARVLAGDTAAASRALTLIINEAPACDALLKSFFSKAGLAHKIGVCGPPGAGKSTLTGRLIKGFRAAGLKVGVLAVDPSSPLSGGAFLGDRLRIQEHAMDAGVFIRSVATRGMVGGVSHTIFGAIHVLEAWGCDRIIVETVGTGQDEVVIAQVADTVVYVTTPTMGDEIQAMKAGIMEIADIFVVNKADLAGKDKAIADLKAALGLGATHEPKAWETPVVGTSALSGDGVPKLFEAIDEHAAHLKSSGEGRERLKAQHREEVSLYVSRRVYQQALGKLDEHLNDLVDHKTDPTTLAAELLKK
jgi:LAO/AO transport system kinase